ncbi:MAG: response regulator transcription factor [Planctomycetes bacterium]|nr:response regulator transcription factor [Planctomycetota bacterium]
MSRPVVLVVEDDTAIRRGLVDALRYAGYEVLESDNGSGGLELAIESPVDLVLLDVMLPKLDGFGVLKELRRSQPTLPVIMVTARGAEEDRVRGLTDGADDYVVKPFSAKELLARVDAVLRRSPQRSADVEALRFDGRMIDLARREVTSADGSTRQLTDREVAILRYLAVSRKRAVDRRELLQHVWGLNPRGIHTRTVDMHIARLREKIEEDPADPRIILTVRGKGYMLAETVQEVGEVAS